MCLLATIMHFWDICLENKSQKKNFVKHYRYYAVINLINFYDIGAISIYRLDSYILETIGCICHNLLITLVTELFFLINTCYVSKKNEFRCIGV